uniref:Regulatory protein zeste n=1 Tax=Timema cristinae TaxID=61476 RepID=A0A7R9HAR2_TIMCR|nr:unnamed protein product [Timema cristinae]
MSQNKEETKKTRRFTTAQIAELVDYMSTHSDLASGRFSCAMGNSAMDRQWEALSKILEEHGPKKTVAQWKTVWRDLKCKVRARLADVNRASRATGNTTYAPPLTEIEKKVLAIIGTASAIGVPSMEEHGLEVAVLEEQPIDIEISFPLPSEFEWIEPHAESLPGPSSVRNVTPPLAQPNKPENFLSSSSKKRKRHTDVEELDSAVKLFQGIQERQNSTNKELATAISKLASAQEGLQSVASTIDKAVAAQLESNNLQAEANRLQSEANRLQTEANRNITALLTEFLLDRQRNKGILSHSSLVATFSKKSYSSEYLQTN